MAFRAIKGMNDVLSQDVSRWQRLERAFARRAELAGYREVRTPIVEATELFVRSIGEVTDVVEKEMYTFQHHRDSMTLRPEGTAGAARAYLEHKVYAREQVTRWYYLGPMFRAERPQRGRYRQFYQAGCEVYGDSGPVVDAEMIDMLVGLFQELGIADLTVAINSLGGSDTRTRHRQALIDHFTPREQQLSEHARERLHKNPLRILDSKDPRDQEASAGAPSLLDMLDAEDRAHFEGLTGALDALKVPYEIDPRLVRGLDYYTRTSFEIRSEAGELGAQNTLAGGGRYDDMVAELGGPKTPAIGFAMGLERILLAMPEAAEPVREGCFIAPLGAEAVSRALPLARELRARGVYVELDGRGQSLKSQLRRADSLGMRLCLVIGESELGRGVAQLKDLERHEQREVALDSVPQEVASTLQVAS
ncbi:MAG: histidine--tRNA ligase [Polyangiaceae bacterium]